MHGRITLACPYCGDSDDEKKKRGNLFWDSLFYHCYNDGCKVHRTLHQLIEENSPGSLKRDDKNSIIDYIKSRPVTFTKAKNLEFELFKKVVELSIPIEDFYRATGAKPIYKNGPGWGVLKDRLLINRADEFAYKPGRLFIMNMTPDKKRVIGYQIRLLSRKTGNKYLTFSLAKMRGELNLSTLDLCESPEELDRLNKLSTIFHILQVDFSKPVTAFEGPIDAKFMKNSLGLASLNRDLSAFKNMPTVRYLFDNDADGKGGLKEMRDLIRKNHTVFLWNKFLKDNIIQNYNIKDLNDVVKVCFKNKLTAFKRIEEYFSKNPLDIVKI